MFTSVNSSFTYIISFQCRSYKSKGNHFIMFDIIATNIIRLTDYVMEELFTGVHGRFPSLIIKKI